MTQGSATDYLIRAALDGSFRELALAEPDRAMAEYDLTEDEKDILRNRDERLLELLGGSIEMVKASAESPQSTEIAAAPGSSRSTLPPVELLLRLAPQTTQSADGMPQVSYAASLHPWPLPEDAKQNEVEQGTNGESPRTYAASELAWLIRMTPTVMGSEAAGLRVAYSAAMHPVDLSTAHSQSASDRMVPPALRSPWRHDVESSAVKTAAQEVLASPKDARCEKLRALIAAMQAGDDRG